VRLALSTRDERTALIARCPICALREVTEFARDIALVIAESHIAAERLRLDGCAPDGMRPRSVAATRARPGVTHFVGQAFANGSRHDGMASGEAGADYCQLWFRQCVPAGRWNPRRTGPLQVRWSK